MKNLNYLLKIGIIYFLLIYNFISFTKKYFIKAVVIIVLNIIFLIINKKNKHYYY